MLWCGESLRLGWGLPLSPAWKPSDHLGAGRPRESLGLRGHFRTVPHHTLIEHRCQLVGDGWPPQGDCPYPDRCTWPEGAVAPIVYGSGQVRKFRTIVPPPAWGALLPIRCSESPHPPPLARVGRTWDVTNYDRLRGSSPRSRGAHPSRPAQPHDRIAPSCTGLGLARSPFTLKSYCPTVLPRSRHVFSSPTANPPLVLRWSEHVSNSPTLVRACF